MQEILFDCILSEKKQADPLDADQNQFKVGLVNMAHLAPAGYYTFWTQKIYFAKNCYSKFAYLFANNVFITISYWKKYFEKLLIVLTIFTIIYYIILY